MAQHSSRLGDWLTRRKAEHDAVAGRALRENCRRIRWVSLAFLPFAVAGAALFWWRPADDLTTLLQLRADIGWVFVALTLAMPLLAWAAHAAAGVRPPGVAARAVSVAAFAALTGFAVAVVAVDPAGSPSVVPFVLACVFAAVLLLMRPLAALLLYATACAGLFAVLGVAPLLQGTPGTTHLEGLGAAGLGLLVSTLLWRTHTANELLRGRLEERGLALQEQQRQLGFMATQDTLTGLRNRREFTRQAEIEVQRALRHRIELCMILLDLDDFKAVNDEHGHAVGDRALRHIAALLGGAVRGTDLLARLGGDEFVILVPHTGPAAAQALAEKLRRLLEQTPLGLDALDLRLTASFGVASFVPADASGFARLQAEAERALLAAKRGGRNRVEMAESEPEPAPPRPH